VQAGGRATDVDRLRVERVVGAMWSNVKSMGIGPNP